MRVLEGKRTALLGFFSLVFTYLFFLEYLRPVRSVSIPFDLPGFHYPLADYAFNSLRNGRFPLWDPTIYSGMPFAANTQAALFYPPSWLLFLGNMRSSTLSCWSLQEFVFLHVWLAFVFSYRWMRARVSCTAALFGAGIFAYSGFMMLQLQHVGFVAGFAWMPLGFSAIDQAASQRRWLPLWKLVAASAMCFLAGYPPLWFVFAAGMGCYAIGHRSRWRLSGGAAAALAFSLLVCMVQLLPAAQIASLKEPEDRYGGGVRDPVFYVSYLIPNLFDFGLDVPPGTNPGHEYLYLGAPAIAGLLFLLVRKRRTEERRSNLPPLLFALGGSALLLTNPFNLAGAVVHGSTFLSQVCRDWCFLAGIPLPVAGLAAIGLDRVLGARAKPRPPWTALAFAGIIAAWSCLCLWLWLPGGRELAAGWASARDAAVQLALFTAGVFLLRSHTGHWRVLVLCALLFGTAVDYKVHGSSKRFNATRQQGAWMHGKFELLDPGIYSSMRANNRYRVAVDRTGPFPQMLRHVRLTTPQGFDPFLTTAYKSLVRNLGGEFYTNWEFAVHPEAPALQILGIRYFVTSEQGPLYQELARHPRFARLEPSAQYYKVFEYLDASPPYGWEDGAFGDIQVTRWDPERRGFSFAAATAPRTFRLSEQWAPDWIATVDGKEATVERWHGALQSVMVPPGAQRVEFIYRPRAVLLGAAVSILSAVALAAAVLLRARRPG